MFKYSNELDKLLEPSSLPKKIDDLADHIVNSVRQSPFKPAIKKKEPLENDELQHLIIQQLIKQHN